MHPGRVFMLRPSVLSREVTCCSPSAGKVESVCYISPFFQTAYSLYDLVQLFVYVSFLH